MLFVTATLVCIWGEGKGLGWPEHSQREVMRTDMMHAMEWRREPANSHQEHGEARHLVGSGAAGGPEAVMAAVGGEQDNGCPRQRVPRHAGSCDGVPPL